MTDAQPAPMPELKSCPFCGEQPELWNGLGTQGEISCAECDISFCVQVIDLIEDTDRFAPENAFNNTTLKYPDYFIAIADAYLIDKWNTRADLCDRRAENMTAAQKT